MQGNRNNMAYICSPYRGDIARNKEYARHLTRVAIDNGFAPVTVHLYITEVTDDENPLERQKGMVAGKVILKECGYMIIGDKYGISSGMKEEIHEARRAGTVILYEKDGKTYLQGSDPRQFIEA